MCRILPIWMAAMNPTMTPNCPHPSLSIVVLSQWGRRERNLPGVGLEEPRWQRALQMIAQKIRLSSDNLSPLLNHLAVIYLINRSLRQKPRRQSSRTISRPNSQIRARQAHSSLNGLAFQLHDVHSVHGEPYVGHGHWLISNLGNLSISSIKFFSLFKLFAHTQPKMLPKGLNDPCRIVQRRCQL